MRNTINTNANVAVTVDQRGQTGKATGMLVERLHDFSCMRVYAKRDWATPAAGLLADPCLAMPQIGEPRHRIEPSIRTLASECRDSEPVSLPDFAAIS